MPAHSYRTIQAPAEGLYKEKGSKFLAFAYPVDSETDIRKKIVALKKEYFDARHHCFAWMMGAEKRHFRAFDDGEPNHSGGDPILGQIKSKEVTNVLIVVVRYFGGVKLGVGGLIGAYKAATEDALNNAIIIEKEVTQVLRVLYSYTSTPDVMRLIKEFNLIIISQKFEDNCELTFEVRTRELESVVKRIELLIAMGQEVKLS